LVDDDAVAIPIPVVAVTIVIGGDVEVVTVEPEAVRPSARQDKDVPRTKAAVVVSVLPRMLQMIVSLVAAFMPDPTAIVVDMRPVRMPFTIAEGMHIRVVVLISTAMIVSITMLISIAMVVMVAVRAMLGNIFMMIPVAVMVPIMITIMIVMILGHNINRKRKQRDDKSDKVLQFDLPPILPPELRMQVASSARIYHKKQPALST
jgi:hypothetical protein